MLDRIVLLNEQNQKLKERVQILEEKEELQRIIITTACLNKHSYVESKNEDIFRRRRR